MAAIQPCFALTSYAAMPLPQLHQPSCGADCRVTSFCRSKRYYPGSQLNKWSPGRANAQGTGPLGEEASQ